jgi:thioredoxin-dependent peroxiredoxin
MVAKGEMAPDFEAPDQDGTEFRLSSLRGSPAVLYFYPEADTSGCTLESKGFRDVYGEFTAQKVAVVGISTDDCPKQKAFMDKYGLPFPLIADSKREVAKKFGVLGPGGKARRVTFLLDPNGTVTEVVEGVPPDQHVARARAAMLKT